MTMPRAARTVVDARAGSDQSRRWRRIERSFPEKQP
jgi:hypothetical protein